MARAADRHEGGKVFGRAGGEPEWSRLETAPNHHGAEVGHKRAAVSCHCGVRVGELWHNATESGAGYWTLMTTVVDDAEARPVKLRFVSQLVEPGAHIVADCPGHGRAQVPVEPLLRMGRKALHRKDGEKLARFVLPCVS